MTAAVRKKRSVRKIVLYIVAALLAAIVLTAGIYIYKCTHYWQPSYNATIKAGFVEKRAELPGGSVINYAEGGQSGGKALLLIHGQTGC